MEELPLNTEGTYYFPFGFQISSKAWERYRVTDLVTGDIRLGARPSMHAIRHLTDRMNEARASGADGKPPVRAGELLLFGVLNEVFRHVIDRYCHEEQPGILGDSLEWTRDQSSAETVERPMRSFADQFPPMRVHQGLQSREEYRRAVIEEDAPCQTALRETILLAVMNENPALRSYKELFDDASLRQETPYPELLASLEAFFRERPPVSRLNLPLFDVLRAPIQANPHSLEGQLRYVLDHWRTLLPASLWTELTFVQDVFREETRPRFLGPGPSPVLRFGHGALSETGYDAPDPEHERFSPDRDWMSNVVLIAKSVYVWLDQLSRTYQRHIHRLDQVPDEELDKLARWGVNGLWLIGLWERSSASQKIKNFMGNPEALASAYSLYDYIIAHDLGGEEAYADLRDRAAHRGIRLASDMVPNHTGIYSKWVVEHPDWFIQVDHPPFPAYRFSGPDLSYDSRVSIRIEDGYWNHSDAAVVFQRVDNDTGQTRYIYHGNDGTSMPWNDTAQLNYLLPEVREAVIQTILHVARRFPIIRFDAAMTLAKRHFQRLWFPKPGDGGAVPSRSEFGMTKAEFDAQMPVEFWREVVDRVAQEAPDTLLLAEAFWLMEGYFVRTLGMHRVYNSAFMNMLKMERNADFRTTIKNVLEFSPQVLKRFVNFMNNPDELTAAEQFGKGDKYFGVAMMMMTLPGLPMIGHGQIEGFTEKYGMEYRRAQWDEPVDEGLVRRHEAEIFPLMHKRYLFSGVEHFALYDFFVPGGHVDENVFAYSNRAGDERALILYNNSYNTTRGWVRTSSRINVGEGDREVFIIRTLGEALSLRSEENVWYVFRDHRDGLEYIRSGRQLTQEGMFVHLRGYQYHAFVDWREVEDPGGTWARLADELQGAGAPNLWALYEEMVAYPVAKSFRKVVHGETICTLAGAVAREDASLEESAAPFLGRYRDFLGDVERMIGRPLDRDAAVRGLMAKLQILQGFRDRLKEAELGADVVSFLQARLPDEEDEPIWFWRIPVAWAILDSLNDVALQCDYEARSEFCVDDWDLMPAVRNAYNELGYDWQAAQLGAQLVRLLVNYRDLLTPITGNPRASRLHRLLDDEGGREFLQVNRYQEVVYFNREQMEALLYWMVFVNAVRLLGDSSLTAETRASQAHALYHRAGEIQDAAAESQYRLETFRELLG